MLSLCTQYRKYSTGSTLRNKHRKYFAGSATYSGDGRIRGKTTVDLDECRAREIVKCQLNKFILCDMSTFEHEYSQVCL